jgi:hypothetical protein
MNSREKTAGTDVSRRDFVKKAAYVAPVVLSLQATSALAKNGSDYSCTPKKADPKGSKKKPKEKKC